ncbi:discoidin domain-containing protein [Nonomuraea jiangxiensis]|uniref:alpha-L-fucosidase n=1 Tax=Nonomuraea jiangxiensis TaxID=633440 RepID=A0A1G8ILN9_9ACTN|nr:discoidin domain-containing protein [Nonomuraea jiangxiensis]SDI19948.1 NPCBM-associated, NEW3 domain of alpha-galactosidase [Nonomuraea jiangxiensis]
MVMNLPPSARSGPGRRWSPRAASRSRRLAGIALALALSLVAALFGAVPAGAEVEHPRQQWMRESTAGLFLHWGMFTAPRHTDCAAWERDVTDGGWTPDYWIDEARKLRASYVVLTTFHSRLGYARPWPSEIPGSCSTKRDFLGELINAGKAKGVHVLLYMTDDPQWHNEAGVETLDSAAYSAYKGRQVNLTTRDGFGMYSYDLFHEVMDNYPDLSGFWIDNDNAYWERNHLYEQIREQRPTWLLSNNNEDTPIMDTVSNEQKTGMTPAYDYPAATYTPMPRLTEADYKLPTSGQWWYDGKDNAVDVPLNVGRYIANAGSSIKSLMAETAMVNGRFPPSQEKFNDFMDTWLPPIWSSISGTEGGGYMYGGMQPGFWNDGAHGVITVADAARTQYVHVLTRPKSQDLVRLRDNGYRVTQVTDVRTGAPLRFTQSGGYLSILGVTNWDTYDTVFQVRTSGQQHFLPSSAMRATASAAKEGFPASNVVDGDYTTYWDSDGDQPVSVTLDLGKRRKVAYLAVNQREWSPTHARESFGRAEDSARIMNYRVHASNDGRNWGEPVRTAAMRSARGVQFIDLGKQDARYLKLEVLDTWSGAQAKPFYKQLRIDEIRVATDYPVRDADGMPLEAEAGANDRDGKARVTVCDACSGGKQITGLGGGGNAVTYRGVQAAAAGTYQLELDYTAAEAGSFSVSVNGDAPIKESVAATGVDVPLDASIAVPLAAGANTIKVFSDDGQGPGLDRIVVGPMPPASYVPRTTMTVAPAGVVWVGPGQQSVEISAKLRLDEDTVDDVRLAPVVPAGWTLEGAPVTAANLRLGQSIEGTWTVTGPAGGQQGPVQVPVKADFRTVGLPHSVSKAVPVQVRPADRVFMREAESSLNDLGSAGVTSCSACSGDQKVRNIGGSADASVRFDDVVVDRAGDYQLYIDFTVNGDRSYFVTVNGGTPIEVPVSGVGNSTVYTQAVTVSLNAGGNTIVIGNDDDSAPDLDRISLAG